MHDLNEPATAGRIAQIAVVGSGPSGCYTAQFLLKADPDLHVTVFDRLPVPFGLVRYGVAADHQGTKAVIRQFERVFDSPRVRFAGNVALGTDLSVAELRENFDAVILATGMSEDRILDVPGARLAGVVGAGAVTRFLNGHPDEAEVPLVCGSDIVIIGAGNVAVDVARLLAKAPEHYEGSDMDDDVHQRIVPGLVSLTLVARSSAETARFDRAMVRELSEVPGVAVEVVGVNAAAADPKSETLRTLAATRPESARVRISLQFATTPVEILGDARVEGVRVRDASGERVIPAQTVVTAIGFTGHYAEVADPSVHAVGWAEHGPTGTIPETRADAKGVADAVRAGLDTASAPMPGFSGLPPSVRDRAVGIEHWKAIDTAEVALARPGRVRQKVRTWEGLLGHGPATVRHGQHGQERTDR